MTPSLAIKDIQTKASISMVPQHAPMGACVVASTRRKGPPTQSPQGWCGASCMNMRQIHPDPWVFLTKPQVANPRSDNMNILVVGCYTNRLGLPAELSWSDHSNQHGICRLGLPDIVRVKPAQTLVSTMVGTSPSNFNRREGSLALGANSGFRYF